MERVYSTRVLSIFGDVLACNVKTNHYRTLRVGAFGPTESLAYHRAFLLLPGVGPGLPLRR